VPSHDVFAFMGAPLARHLDALYPHHKQEGRVEGVLYHMPVADNAARAVCWCWHLACLTLGLQFSTALIVQRVRRSAIRQNRRLERLDSAVRCNALDRGYLLYKR